MSANDPKQTFATVNYCIAKGSLDHFVGAGTHTLRNGKVEPFGGLEIEHQFVLGRRLYWKISRPLALEDAIDIAGRGAKLV